MRVSGLLGQLIHHVIVRKSFLKAFFVVILLLPIAYFFSFKENSATLLFWSFMLSGFLVILLLPWKPVDKECISPVTCYWNLCLLERGKEELMWVFKERHPAMKMLLPIWKALCASIDNQESSVKYRDNG